MENTSSKYWKTKKIGQPKKYNPENLWTGIQNFFTWCDNNKWMKNEVIKGGTMSGQIVQVPTERPYTISGLSVFLGMSVKTFENYGKMDQEKEPQAKDYLRVITRARDIMYTQKFEGAAVGAFNPLIIARDLHLRENVDVVSDGKKITRIKKVVVVHANKEEYEKMKVVK